MPPLQSSSGARVLSYLYRYDDLLHQKVGPRGTETLTWDGADPLFWQRSQDGLFQLVVHGNSAIRSVGTGSGGGVLANHLHLDAQANVQATTDATRAISQDVAWDLFGDVTLGQSKSNPLDYGGGMGYWNDYDTPLTYVRARWLDPNTGRWLSRDPVETEHPYAYAGNSPMLYADPTGTQSQDVDLMGHPLHGRRKKHHPDNDLMGRRIERTPGTRRVQARKPKPGTLGADTSGEKYELGQRAGDFISGSLGALSALAGFLSGEGPNTDVNHPWRYSPFSTESRQMKHSRAGENIRGQLYQVHYHVERPNVPIPDPSVREWNGIGTWDAFKFTLGDVANPTELQVGGFDWKAVRDDDNNRMIVTIRNRMDANSFFYHLWGDEHLTVLGHPWKGIPGLTKVLPPHWTRKGSLFGSGVLGDVYQEFTYYETIPVEYRIRPMSPRKTVDTKTMLKRDPTSEAADRLFDIWQRTGKLPVPSDQQTKLDAFGNPMTDK